MRYNVIVAIERPSLKRTIWHPIGKAWDQPLSDGKMRICVSFYSLPLPMGSGGQTECYLVPEDEKSGGEG